jgi:hypothetical protein
VIGTSYSPWYSASTAGETERVINAWKDAPASNAEVLRMLLDVALEQVVQYAPEDDSLTTTSAPTRYVWAQLQQAKNLWNAGRVLPNGDVGTGDFVFVPRPLSREIQRVIRPVKGTPSVF